MFKKKKKILKHTIEKMMANRMGLFQRRKMKKKESSKREWPEKG